MPTISREFHAHSGNYTPGGNSRRYIVVHYTGGAGSARNTAAWSQNDRHESSFHYVLDGQGTIYQILDDSDTAWAVGAWSGYRQLIGNGESISIEVCSNGEDFTPAEISELAWLVQRLMRDYGIPRDRVVRHYDCHTGHKHCPAPYVDERKWIQLKNQITTSDPSRVVQLWPTNGTDAQRWQPVHNSDGTFTLINRACGLALDVQGAGTKAGTPVQLYPKNGTDAQRFVLEQVPRTLVPYGQKDEIGFSPDIVRPFVLIPKIAKAMRVDCVGGGTQGGTRIQIYGSNNSRAQWWYVLDDGLGSWTLINDNSPQLALDALNGGR